MDLNDVPAPGTGDLGVASRCYEKGCTTSEVDSCQFTDRHGRHCLSTWCIAHRVTDDEKTFCRRHASFAQALGTYDNTAALPELENRAPSLVNWVSNGVDAEVRAMLAERGAGHEGVVLAHDPVHLLVGIRGRRWGRSWSLRGPDGHDTLRVSIEVDEHSDPELAVRVDGDVITRSIAPWIGHRLRGEWVPPEIDAAERKGFYADLIAVIREAIDEAVEEGRASG